jgi:hypothetical protein
MGTVNNTKWFNVVNMGGRNDKDIRRDEVLREGVIDPQLWFVLSVLRRVAAIGEVMKSDVPSSFYSPTAVIGPRDPDKESLRKRPVSPRSANLVRLFVRIRDVHMTPKR